MKLKPLHDQILVKVDKGKQYTGKIVLPQTKIAEMQIAQVVATGDKVPHFKIGKDTNWILQETGKYRPHQVKQGDWIVMAKYAGKTVDNREQLYMIRDMDLQFIIPDIDSFTMDGLTDNWGG